MIRASYKDKSRVVDILSRSFDNNKSVNYVLKKDHKKAERIQKLMEYSFEMCYRYGDVFLSHDNKGCALILLPDKKKTNLKTILLDINLIVSCMGLSNIRKAMEREAKIKKLQSKGLKYYLWFIGVDPLAQNKGIGSRLMGDVIQEAACKARPIYLETSTLKNIPWYEKFGFKIYNEIDIGYRLYFMKNE